jgi:RNA polymerase sigma-70 factor, ECF subfamily
MNYADPHERRFAGWLQSHGAILHQLSRAYAPEAADVDELQQEMRVQLWRSVANFRDEAKASTWIYRVCLNTALTWRRTERRRVARVVVQPDAVETATSAESGPAVTQEKQDLMATLLKAVRQLPAGERTLIVLALDGLSHREIGEITGMTENYVGVAMSRARQKLTLKLKDVTHEL